MKVRMVAYSTIIPDDDSILFNNEKTYFDESPTRLIELAGRVCVGKEKDNVRNLDEASLYVEDKILLGHHSLLEHASATFMVYGISRVCSHQLVRHRIASYSQRSERYCNEKDAGFVYPPSIFGNKEAESIYRHAIGFAQDAYEALLGLGINKEDARFVLPQSTETSILITMNFRSWRHFIEERCSKKAQWEIRDMAMFILEDLYNLCPSVFGDLWEKYNG